MSAYKIVRNGGVAHFKWSINYGLQWSQQSEVSPGVVVGQGAEPTSVSTDPGASNYVDFTADNDTPQFANLKNKGSPGSLFINTIGANPRIPSDTFVFGLSVNEKLAWATPAQNGLQLTMTPVVDFWLTSGEIIVQSQVLEADVTTGAVKFDFKDGKNNALVTLGSDNVWTSPEYSATPLYNIAETTKLQSTPTVHSFSSRNVASINQTFDAEALNPCRTLITESHSDLTKSLLSLTQSELKLINNLGCGNVSARLAMQEGKDAHGVSTSVTLNKLALEGGRLITGTITIGAAVGVGFAYMVASGITLKITSESSATSIQFSYDGTAAREAILLAFKTGTEILFKS